MTKVTLYDSLTWTPQTRRVPDDDATEALEEATFALYMAFESGRMILRKHSTIMASLVNAAHGDLPGDPTEAFILRFWHKRGTLSLPSEMVPERARTLKVAQIDYNT